MYPHDESCLGRDAKGRLICVCDHPRPWRVRKIPQAAEQPWFIWERTANGPYELHHRTGSFASAVVIVDLVTRRARRPS